MKKTIAMDIDGTIIVKGEIDKNVTSFFENDDIRKCNLMFLTGNSMKIASALVKKIANNYPKYKNKKYYIATNNGASIYNKDGELVYSNPINKKKIIKISKKLKKKYNPCDIMLTTLDNNYVELLANGGIVGFCFYYFIYVKIIWSLWKSRKNGNKLNKLIFTMAILDIIMQYGYVSYYSKLSYIYLMVYCIYIEAFKNKNFIQRKG